MNEAKNTYIPPSPENPDSQESIQLNTQDHEDTQTYETNLRTKQESIRIMENVETHASQHPDICLNFTSPEMTRYFQILMKH